MHVPHETTLLALASLIGWGYMFFFIMPLRFTGPFVIMIYKMLFNDVLRFCCIYIYFFWLVFHNHFLFYLMKLVDFFWKNIMKKKIT